MQSASQESLAVDLVTVVASKWFYCGFTGALMPMIVRFYQVASKGRTVPIKNWWLFSIASFLYATFAGSFAYFWQPTTTFHAMWVGISFSVLVTNIFESGKTAKLSAREVAAGKS